MTQYIYNHIHPEYQARWRTSGANRYNGAYYYSQEICRNIIPRIKTERSWNTIKIPNRGTDHEIVFIHNNQHPEYYDYLKRYRDQILVCGIPETCDKIRHLGTPIYLPLSVDVAEVEKYKTAKTRKRAFIGRPSKRKGVSFPRDTFFIEGMERGVFLRTIAKFEEVYAVGRCAIEAKILGAKILPYDERFPDPERWEILDNKDAAKMLQQELDRIDGRKI